MIEQRALVAARRKAYHAELAKARMKAGTKADPMVRGPEGKGTARDLAGRELGVSGSTVDRAEQVLKHGSKKLVGELLQYRNGADTMTAWQARRTSPINSATRSNDRDCRGRGSARKPA